MRHLSVDVGRAMHIRNHFMLILYEGFVEYSTIKEMIVNPPSQTLDINLELLEALTTKTEGLKNLSSIIFRHFIYSSSK